MNIDKESIESAQSLITLITGGIGLLSLIFKFFNDHRKGKYQELDESKKIELIDKIVYEDNQAKNSLKKSLTFRSLTGKTEFIQKIHLIMECHDPAMALYIYSQAPNYIKIEQSASGNKLNPPKSLYSPWDNLFLSIMSLSGHLGFLANYMLLTLIVSNTSKSSISASNLLSSIIALSIFFSFTTYSFWYFIKYSNKEIEILKKTRKFYEIETEIKNFGIWPFIKNVFSSLHQIGLPRKRKKTQ